MARPQNETVERICAYLAANYPAEVSLTEVAAQFLPSPYYLSRLFRRVTASPSWIISTTAASKLPRSCWKRPEFSISAVAEQTGFATAAHFRRVFRG